MFFLKFQVRRRTRSADYVALPEGEEAHWEVAERILFLYGKLNPGQGYVQVHWFPYAFSQLCARNLEQWWKRNLENTVQSVTNYYFMELEYVSYLARKKERNQQKQNENVNTTVVNI